MIDSIFKYIQGKVQIVDSLGNITSTPLAVAIDETSIANVTYIGKAAVGSATSAAVWQVQKINTASGTVITWAGSAAFNQIWDNRTSLTYT